MPQFTYLRAAYEPSEHDEPFHVLDEEELGDDAGEAFVVMFEDLVAVELLPPDLDEAAEAGVEASWWDWLQLEVEGDQVVLRLAQRGEASVAVVRLARGVDGIEPDVSTVPRNVD